MVARPTLLRTLLYYATTRPSSELEISYALQHLSCALFLNRDRCQSLVRFLAAVHRRPLTELARAADGAMRKLLIAQTPC